ICCACDSLAWHRGVKNHEVFSELLPSTPEFRAIGKSMFEALRHGLAHRFRPDTIMIGSECCRFTIAWKDHAHLGVIEGDPTWVQLNMQVLSEKVTSAIDSYQHELEQNASERERFQNKHDRYCVRPITDGTRVASAWRAVLGKLKAPT